MSLKSQEKRSLIAKAHALHPVVIIGNEGLTPAVLLEIERALYDHELIKIRLPSLEKPEKIQLIDSISRELGADCLKMIGHVLILYRVSNKKRKG